MRALVLSCHVYGYVWLVRFASIVTLVSSVCEAIWSEPVVVCGRKLFRKEAEWSTEVVVDKSSCAIHGKCRKVWVKEVDSASTGFLVKNPLDRCRPATCCGR